MALSEPSRKPGEYVGLLDANGNEIAGAIKTALQTIDDFISGNRGLITEDNSGSIKTAIEAINTALQTGGISQVQLAAMVTALQTIDNFISGSKGLVTEDNSGTIKTAVEAINTALQTGGISQVQFAAMVTALGSMLTALQLIDNAVSGNSFATFRTTGGITGSGVKSADALIKNGAGAVYWMTVSDTAALAVELNDSTANGGTDAWAIDLPAGAYAHFIFDPPIPFATGIYLDVSTATCKVTIGYI